MNRLQPHGLVISVTLHGDRKQNHMLTISNAVQESFREHHLRLSRAPHPPVLSPLSGPNLQLRQQYNNLPFHLLALGNAREHRSVRNVSIDGSQTFKNYTTELLLRDYNKSVCPQHDDMQTKLLVLGE